MLIVPVPMLLQKKNGNTKKKRALNVNIDVHREF